MSNIDTLNMQHLGQINSHSLFGSYIYKICKNPNIKTVVEIGTWNGFGSTKCVLDAISDDSSKHLTSIELYPEMYRMAKENISKYIKNINQITLLNGSIISYKDAFWFDHNTIDIQNDGHAKLWYQKDMEFLKKSENVLSKIPEKIDLLILDGGEYTSYPEFKLLKDRSNIIALDDIYVHKNKKTHNELYTDNQYICLISSNERNGFSIFERKQ